MKTLGEIEKLLVTSNFSFSHSICYTFVEHSSIFVKFEIFVCKLSVWKSLKFVVWEWVKRGSISNIEGILTLLPNGKILDKSKLKAFPDNKSQCNLKAEILFGIGRKQCGKRRKLWLPAFSPFSTMFSKGFISGALKVRIRVK